MRQSIICHVGFEKLNVPIEIHINKEKRERKNGAATCKQNSEKRHRDNKEKKVCIEARSSIRGFATRERNEMKFKRATRRTEKNSESRVEIE